MVGRGCLGNPWIFKEINAYLEEGKVIDKPTPEEKIDMSLKHFDSLLKTLNKNQAVLEIRSHIAWYLKGIEGSKEIKDKVFKTRDEKEIRNILLEYKNKVINSKC